MSIFDESDDPFDKIVREFFGGSGVARSSGQRKVVSREEDRAVDYIENDGSIYLLFELPGFTDKDVTVSVTGREIEIRAQKQNGEKMQSYLHQKLASGVVLQKRLPDIVIPKKFNHTMCNGILEIEFVKGGRK